jgi:hypothetical protein
MKIKRESHLALSGGWIASMCKQGLVLNNVLWEELHMKKLNKALSGLLCLGLVQGAMADGATQLLFGDTHLHTSYSFDAYLNKNQTADPDTAYRWAKGLPVIHPFNRARVQIDTPLDFLVVSDHAELMGVIRATNMGTAEQDDLGLWGNCTRRTRRW